MSRNKLFVATLITAICIFSAGSAFARMTGGGYHVGGGSFAMRQNAMTHTMNRSGYDHMPSQIQNQNQNRYRHQDQNQNQDQYQHQNQNQNQNQDQYQNHNQERIGNTGPAEPGQNAQSSTWNNGLQLQDRDRIDQPPGSNQ